MSLSTWFRDYLYIPLGGSRGGIKTKIRNTFIIFLVSGFWHGANWTYVIWGLLNAIYFLPLMLFDLNRNNLDVIAKNKLFPRFNELFQVGITFSLTILAWVFFRADNVGHAFDILGEIFSTSIFSVPEILPITVILFILIFVLIEWLGREQQFAIERLFFNRMKPIRWCFYLIIVFCVVANIDNQQDFIYFQF